MTILFHGEAELDGIKYQWVISEGSLGSLIAVASARSATVAAVVEARPQSQQEAKRLCDALLPQLRARLLRARSA